jgi:hypothetical protein
MKTHTGGRDDSSAPVVIDEASMMLRLEAAVRAGDQETRCQAPRCWTMSRSN